MEVEGSAHCSFLNSRVESKAYRYWFFIYNLLHEYLGGGDANIGCDLTDFKDVEKCFGENAINLDAPTEKPAKEKLRTSDVISVLKQFIEQSNYAEFGLRMRILKSFEFYLQYLTMAARRRSSLISIIHNLHSYYTQFSGEIEETIRGQRKPIEKKLKEFVKIESYNKDLSYFSMKNNIARVHRHLHKFLREFEEAVSGKIAATVFVYRPNQTVSLTIDEKGKHLRHEPKVTYYIIDIKNFVAPQTLKGQIATVPAEDVSQLALLPKVDSLFMTSRKIVKQAVLHSQFPGLIYNLDSMLSDQIETCDYLRKLEVDRNQEKPKQKVQAKQILQQKRKALADTYKTLTSLGLSYRSGLLETSLKTELVDLKIAPYCVQRMIIDSGKHKKIDQNLLHLNDNLDLYYTKCMFKLKLLQTILLTPSAELGLPNLERIKGFAVDLFLLVQSQRKTISKSVKELYDFQRQIEAIGQLQVALECDATSIDFRKLSLKIAGINSGLTQIFSVFEQFELLLKCAPIDENREFTVVSAENVSSITRSSPKYERTKVLCSKILTSTKTLLDEVQKVKAVIFHNSSVVLSIDQRYNAILDDVKSLKMELRLNDGQEMSVLGRSLIELWAQLNEASDETQREVRLGENNSSENINTELENIVHGVLLAMQTIYKKYSVQAEELYTSKEVTKEETEAPATEKNVEEEAEDDFSEDQIQQNHLKQKIHAEIEVDLVTLNINKIISKLSSILLVVQHLESTTEEKTATIRKIVSILPILEQFYLLCKYYLTQQFGAHKVSSKMLSVMLTVFIELGAKGFCIPQDLMQDEDGESKESEDKKGEGGFGFEDGTGENDVSDKIESEDQLDTAKKPGDDNQTDDKEDADCKEEKGIDMSEDFDSKLQDVEKRGEDSDESDKDDDDDDADKQMGETEEGAEK